MKSNNSISDGTNVELSTIHSRPFSSHISKYFETIFNLNKKVLSGILCPDKVLAYKLIIYLLHI